MNWYYSWVWGPGEPCSVFEEGPPNPHLVTDLPFLPPLPLGHSYLDGLAAPTVVDNGSCSGSSCQRWLRSVITNVQSDIRYTFETIHIADPDDEYLAPNQWFDEDLKPKYPLSLKLIERKNAAGTYEDIIHGTVDASGRVTKMYFDHNNALSQTLSYDADGRLTQVKEWGGAVEGKEFNYDWDEITYDGYFDSTAVTSGVLTHFDAGCGSCPEYNYEYDNYSLTAVKDENDNILKGYEYDASGRRITRIYRKPSGGSEATLYRATTTDSPHTITHYTYQSNTASQVRVDYYDGELTKREFYPTLNPSIGSGAQAVTLARTYGYDVGNGVSYLSTSTKTRPRGNQEREYYFSSADSFNRVSAAAVYGGSSEVVLNEYDYTIINSRTLLEWNKDVTGATTDYVYSGEGNLEEVSYPDVSLFGGGQVAQLATYDYDGGHRLTLSSRKKSNGGTVSTAYEYDAKDRLTLMREDDGGLALETSYAYDAFGRLTETEDPRGVRHIRGYTSNGILERAYTLALGSSDALSLTMYEYDSRGRVTKLMVANQDGAITSPASYSGSSITTAYLYDAFGRNTGTVADAGGLNLTTTYEYDNQDRAVKVTTPGGVFTQTDRDGRGRQIRQIVGASGGNNLTTSYEYDANSNMTKVIEPNGVMTTYEYDLFDRRTKATRSTS